MKQVVILAGVSGAGKSYLRTHYGELSSLPCIDMNDLYQEKCGEDWCARMQLAKDRLGELLRQHDKVVIEGWFLPGTPSLKQLLEFIWQQHATPVYMLQWVPLYVIEERLKDDPHRLALAKRGWRSLYRGL